MSDLSKQLAEILGRELAKPDVKQPVKLDLFIKPDLSAAAAEAVAARQEVHTRVRTIQMLSPDGTVTVAQETYVWMNPRHLDPEETLDQTKRELTAIINGFK